MFFDSWTSILRVIIVGSLAYTGLILILRISGKRTLSQMNIFDLVVTVALGSTLATVLLSKTVALVEGLTALALLVVLQYIVAYLSIRFPSFSRLIKAEPRLLFFRGEFLEESLKKERVKKEEILQALRNQGVTFPEKVEAVVLETNGSFSILQSSSEKGRSTLYNVKR